MRGEFRDGLAKVTGGLARVTDGVAKVTEGLDDVRAEVVKATGGLGGLRAEVAYLRGRFHVLIWAVGIDAAATIAILGVLLRH